MAEDKSARESLLKQVLATVQIVSVAGGVVVSVLQFSAAQKAQAQAQKAQARAQCIEAQQPFWELRQKVYAEAAKAAASIANAKPEAVEAAKQRFRDLYVAELTMVEDAIVERRMVQLAEAVDPELRNLNPGQRAALNLAKALGESFSPPDCKSIGVEATG